MRIHREQPRYNRTTDRPNPIRRPIPGTTRTLRVRDRQSVPGSTDGQPRDLHGGGGAGAAAAAGCWCWCCCCWCCCCCCCCCCCQSVVVEAMVVVVTVEVEDGPALEEAGASTAPTPGFVPTTSPVDNATATPGSFRVSSSSSSSFHFPPSFTFSVALLLNFLPLSSSPFASLRLLPILLLLFSLSSSSSSSNCTITLASLDSSRHHLRVLVDSLPSPSYSSATFAFSYLSHDSFSSDDISLFQRRGSCFPPSSVRPSTLLAVVAATLASSPLSHTSRVRAEPDEIQRRFAYRNQGQNRDGKDVLFV